MKTAYINAFPPQEFFKEGLTWDEKLHLLSDNTGNLLYVNELKEQIDYELEGWLGEERYRTEEFTAGILPTSNILRKYCTCAEEWVQLINNVRFPVTLAGMGSQSYIDCRSPKEVVNSLPSERKQAFREIAEQTVSLGIRGGFTAECLELMGITNYRIIGCPSFYKFWDGECQKWPEPTLEKITFNLVTARSHGHKVLEWGRKGEYILQTPAENPAVIFDRDAEVTEEFIKKKFPGYKGTKEELNVFMKEHAHMFFSLEEWKDYLRSNNFSFSFGMCFHGNMVAHLCGIPSLWIVHDSRTRELIETLKLPSIDYDDLPQYKYIEELVEQCDYSEMYKNYRTLYKEYVSYLNENGINHKLVMKEE